MAVDWRAIEQAGVTGAVGAIERGLDRITARAKELAPVRKVYGQNQKPYRTRLKSIAEIEEGRDVRKRLGLGPEHPYLNPPSIVAKRAPQNLSQRTLILSDKFTGRRLSRADIKHPGSVHRLDRRGRYELRTLRAQHGDQLGGRLRSEIFRTPVRVEGKRISGKVVSPTPYAKYQELGTRHNPAHPYLRPAGHEGREPIRRDIGRSVAAAAKPLFRGRFEVVAKTRVR